MLDLNFVRSNLELVEAKLRARGADPEALLGDFRQIDQARRAAITRSETIAAERNRLNTEIFSARKSQGQNSQSQSPPSTIAQKVEASVALTQDVVDARPLLLEKLRKLKSEAESLEREAAEADERLRTLMQAVPNLPQASVPEGKSEHDNVVVKTWGTIPTFPADAPPKPHWELGEALGILDFERAAKISGSRFTVHFGQGARLERALANFMLDLHIKQHGYTEVLPPQMVNSKSLYGTSQLPKFAEDLFHCDDKGAFTCPANTRTTTTGSSPPPRSPSPTSSATRSSTPKTCPSASAPTPPASAPRPAPTARTPAASSASTSSRRSNSSSSPSLKTPKREHEALTRHAEAVLEALGLPYRRMLLCTGDMGFGSAKTYDLEVWLPGQNLYREISSCSNFEAFQARRANIKFRAPGQKKAEFLHTLNGSGLAVGRTYLAILENYQQPDGTVRIPPALVPYMDGETLITPQTGAWMPRSQTKAAKAKP